MNLNPITEAAKIRADHYRLEHIKQQLDAIAKTCPCPQIKRIATNAKKEITL